MTKRVEFYWNFIFLVCDICATLLLYFLVIGYLSIFVVEYFVIFLFGDIGKIVWYVGWIRLSWDT